MPFMAAAIVVGALAAPISYYAILWLAHERRERARASRSAALLHHPDIEELDADLDTWYG